MKNFPILNLNQFAVMIADSDTGIILNLNGEVSKNNIDEDIYAIFDDIKSAKEFVQGMVLVNNKREFVIYDYEQQVIEFIKGTGS